MKYRVIGQINHDGIVYKDGAEIELSNAEAEPLLGVKAIEPFIKPFSRGAKTETSTGEGV